MTQRNKIFLSIIVIELLTIGFMIFGDYPCADDYSFTNPFGITNEPTAEYLEMCKNSTIPCVPDLHQLSCPFGVHKFFYLGVYIFGITLLTWLISGLIRILKK